MAGSGNFSFLAFFLIASGVVGLSVAQVVYEDSSVTQEDFEDAPVPEPVTETEEETAPVRWASKLADQAETYLFSCGSKLTERCGDVIFGNIFMKQNNLVPTCCKKLVVMGKECHEAMVSFIINSPAFSKNSSITVPRSKQVWNQCVLLAKEAPSPS